MLKKIFMSLMILLVIVSISGCLDNNNNDEENNSSNNNEINENIDTIYNDNESINLFLNKYNDLNDPDITSDMISKTHIGASDRDDVITVSNDVLTIHIYEDYKMNDTISMSVYIGYKSKILHKNEDFKEQFIKYIKVFDNTLTNDEIDSYWNDMISEYRSSYEINDIDIMLGISKGEVSDFKFTSKMSFH